MDIYSLALFVTDDCNFNCRYCYQDKGNMIIDDGTVKKAIDFFFSFLKNGGTINFYGGEPLLALDQIYLALDYVRYINRRAGKKINFSLTTNGSLISDDVLYRLNLNHFDLLLSFDGVVQEISRQDDSYEKIVSIIKKTIEYPHIDLETNSVFTPSTIADLSRSIISIIELGVRNISLALSQTATWDRSSLSLFKKELEVLADFLRVDYERTGHMPVVNFRKYVTKGLFTCQAARDRIAVAADGKLWGCHMFADVFKRKADSTDYAKFCFGDLESFIKSNAEIYPKISANYAGLRMDRFYTEETCCSDCTELELCHACPMENMMHGPKIEKIPAWACGQKKIMREVKNKFWLECD